MILRLLLILYLSSNGSSSGVGIEKERCNEDTACFIRESCLKIEPGPGARITKENVLARYKNEDLIEDDCDVFLQIKPFTNMKYHFIIQIKSPTESITSDGVALNQGEEQFRCDNRKETAKPGDFVIASLGDRHSFDSKSIFCSFTLTTADPRFIFQSLFNTNLDSPEIVFTTGTATKNTIKFGGMKNEFWKSIDEVARCDPDIIQPEEKTNDTHILEMVDNLRSSILCAADSEMLMVKRIDDSVDFPKQIYCENLQWTYKIEGENVAKTIGIVNRAQEIVTVSCIRKICSMCNELEEVPSCEGCEKAKYNNAIKTDCVTSKCSDNAWVFPGGLNYEGTMECKKKQASAQEATWYFTYSGTTKSDAFPVASCARKEDCFTKAGFNVTADENQDPPALTDNNREISCKKKKHLLIYNVNQTRFEAKTAKCSALTGTYLDDNGRTVPPGVRLYCGLPLEPTTLAPPSGASALSRETIIAIGAGCAVALCLGLIAAGVIVVVRRKRRLEAREKARKDRMEAMAAAAASTNPDVAVLRRNLSEKEKTPWELRKRVDRNKWYLPDPEHLKDWTNPKFFANILVHYCQFSPTGRLAVLTHATALDAYSLKKIDLDLAKEEEKERQNGTLKQFFWLWKHGYTEMLDCPLTWEYKSRFMRILYESFIQHDDHREIGKKMVKLVVAWARPMLTELTYKLRDSEEECDTNLRFLAVRMLLWAEAPDVIAELTRQADLPLHQLQSPMRALVWQYAVRYLGRADSFKEQYWEHVKEDSQEAGIFGTIRQHILFALCGARDEKRKDTEDEFRVLKETMTTIFDYGKVQNATKSFTPLDQLWAFRGAAEHVSNMKPAVDLFNSLVPTDPDETLERLIMFRSNQDKEAAVHVRDNYKKLFIDMINLCSEMCTMSSQFNQLQGSTGPLMLYLINPEDPLIYPLPFDALRFQQRTANLNTLICDRNVADYFHKAITAIV